MNSVSARTFLSAIILVVPMLVAGCCNEEAACAPIVPKCAPAAPKCPPAKAPSVCAPVVSKGIYYDPTPVFAANRPTNERIVAVSAPVATAEKAASEVAAAPRDKYEQAVRPAPDGRRPQRRHRRPGHEGPRGAGFDFTEVKPLDANPVVSSGGIVIPAPTVRINSDPASGPGTADLVDGGPAALSKYDRPETFAAGYPDLSAAELEHYAVGTHVGMPTIIPVPEDPQ